MDPHAQSAHGARNALGTEEPPPITDRADADASFVGRWLPLLLVALIALFALHACLTQPPLTTAQAPFNAEAAAQQANARARAALASLGPGTPTAQAMQALNQIVVHFAEGSSDVPAAVLPLLAEAARVIEAQPAGVRVLIVGHTDNRGAADANAALSRQRADSTRDALVGAGVRPERLQTAGVGDAQPIASNATEEGRFRNRRIEFVALP